MGTTHRESFMPLNKWRITGWLVAIAFVALPWVAMQFTDQVNWNSTDFAVFGTMVVGVGLVLETFFSRSSNTYYRAGAGLSLCGMFLLFWLSVGVGIIGRDGDPANLLYLIVLSVGMVGTVRAKFKPRGMARTLIAVAIAQALVMIVAVIAQLGHPPSGPVKLLLLNGFFIALFAISARLFHRSTNRP